MRLSPRHAIAATAVSGAVLLGGAGWAAAQDADDAPTSTEADPGADAPDGRADRGPGTDQGGRPEDCPDDAGVPSDDGSTDDAA